MHEMTNGDVTPDPVKPRPYSFLVLIGLVIVLFALFAFLSDGVAAELGRAGLRSFLLSVLLFTVVAVILILAATGVGVVRRWRIAAVERRVEMIMAGGLPDRNGILFLLQSLKGVDKLGVTMAAESEWNLRICSVLEKVLEYEAEHNDSVREAVEALAKAVQADANSIRHGEMKPGDEPFVGVREALASYMSGTDRGERLHRAQNNLERTLTAACSTTPRIN